jgi:hypothetical protein
VRRATPGLAIALLLPSLASAQSFSQRGFVEGRGLVYPQTVPGDDRRAGADLFFRYEPSFRPAPWLTLTASVDARLDTLGEVDRSWRVDWLDRTRLRPALSVRRARATVSRGGVAIDLGRQFVRWGKADILNPTDRFAPRDFMEVVASDFLAVAGARLTYERKGGTIDLVWVPFFTPSRLPLAGRRWAVESRATEFVATVDGPDESPRGSQIGARWNHVMSGFEYSLSFYNGFNHLPLLDPRFTPFPPRIEIFHVYPRLRMYGGDAAWPTRWFTLKGEAGYFTSGDARADEYGLYVIQIERQAGEWYFVSGYSGEIVTKRRALSAFAPDRGLTRSFLGRASRTIDASRSVAFQGVIRHNGHGGWLEGEYSQTTGRHWRTTLRFDLIRGRTDDFLGQYRRNSHLTATLRYSF